VYRSFTAPPSLGIYFTHFFSTGEIFNMPIPRSASSQLVSWMDIDPGYDYIVSQSQTTRMRSVRHMARLLSIRDTAPLRDLVGEKLTILDVNQVPFMPSAPTKQHVSALYFVHDDAIRVYALHSLSAPFALSILLHLARQQKKPLQLLSQQQWITIKKLDQPPEGFEAILAKHIQGGMLPR
jgi:hypothetical protein